MKRKLFSGIVIVIIALVTGVSYAASNGVSKTVEVTSTTTSFFGAGKASDESSHPGYYESLETGNGKFDEWKVIEGETGGTGSDDLYVIWRKDGATIDGKATLYLNNAANLADGYEYLNLNVHVYGFDGTNYVPLNSQILTLSNGYVTFKLPYAADGTEATAYDHYSISINQGSFFCDDASEVENLKPEFFLKVE